MFTLLADAMYTAALVRRGACIPENLKDHPTRRECRARVHRRELESYRHLW